MEYTDSEEEMALGLKPVLKRARMTVTEKEKEARQAKKEIHKLVEERKRQTLRWVEESKRKQNEIRSSIYEKEGNFNNGNTEDQNDELEYEPWNMRELKRNIRDREERESTEKERSELERLRNMTEEEKRKEALLNPGIIITLAMNGKYKFLRKYYPGGAFY